MPYNRLISLVGQLRGDSLIVLIISGGNLCLSNYTLTFTISPKNLPLTLAHLIPLFPTTVVAPLYQDTHLFTLTLSPEAAQALYDLHKAKGGKNGYARCINFNHLARFLVFFHFTPP